MLLNQQHMNVGVTAVLDRENSKSHSFHPKINGIETEQKR